MKKKFFYSACRPRVDGSNLFKIFRTIICFNTVDVNDLFKDVEIVVEGIVDYMMNANLGSNTGINTAFNAVVVRSFTRDNFNLSINRRALDE